MVTLAIAACQRVNTGTQQPTSRSDNRVITHAMLLTGGASNVYDAIAKVRPQCFTQRLSQTGRPAAAESGKDPYFDSSNRPITLYVDNTRVGSAEELRSMSLGEVAQVECLNATDAAQRFGLNNVAGAIVVKTGKQ